MNNTMTAGLKVVHISENNYAGKEYIMCCFIGDVAVHSKTYKTLKGAEKAGRAWLGI